MKALTQYKIFLLAGLFLFLGATAQQIAGQAVVKPQSGSFVLPSRSNVSDKKMKVEKKPLLQRYYEHSGIGMISVLSCGYSTYFLYPNPGVNTTQDLGKRHMLNFEVFEWRARLLGMSLFNFEMGINTPHAYPGDILPLYQRGGLEKSQVLKADEKTMWFAYKPGAKVYIPIAKWCAAEVYGGVSVDITRVWNKVAPNYYKDHPEVPEQNFFLGAYGGAGIVFTPAAALPIELKAEYRRPLSGNTALVPHGFYLSAQLHIANPIRKNQDESNAERDVQ